MAVKEEEGLITPATLAQLFATLCSDYVLDALFLHARLPQVGRWTTQHRRQPICQLYNSLCVCVSVF